MTYSKENVRNMQLLVTSLLQIKTGNSKLLITATNNETLLMGELAVTKKSEIQKKFCFNLILAYFQYCMIKQEWILIYLMDKIKT